MALQWLVLLLFTPLLAAQNRGKPYPSNYGKPQGRGKCKAPSYWDTRLRFSPRKHSYALNEVVQLSCAGKIPGKFAPSVPHIQCISRGDQILWNETVTCKERCQQPQWDSQLQFRPNQRFYWVSEVVTLSCWMNDTPPLAMIRCANWKDAWEVLDIWGTWHRLAENLICATAKCPKPLWDARLQFLENEAEFPQIRELTLTCPKGLEPSFPEVKCTKEIQGVRSGKPVYVDAWWGRNSTGAWTRIERDVLCMEMCQRPLWDSTLQLVPHKDNYEKDEEVKLSCPEGFQPPFTEIQCQTQLQYDGYGTPTPVSKEFWHGRDSRGAWVPIQSSLECTEVLQVDPETFEISSTSIKLKWTCRFPDACQGMRAMCRLAAPSSPPCEAEEVNGEQMLHGQEGTFTCSPLQPFTEYSVTIGLPSSTVIYRKYERTKAAVPDKPEQLWLDPDRGSLRWSSLPSCNGEIIGYQLSITARNAGDSSVLETERLRLDGSVTEHRLPEHSPGSSYAVTIQGLTAAGAGAALMREFHGNSSSDTPRPQAISCRSVRDIAPAQGTAVLPLRPIARGSEAAREHQLIVAATHNGSLIESICSGQPRLSNASVYLAAVLNLTAPTDFVLGDGSRGQGEHNAALRPGRDYTALLRLVRLGPQAEKFTCVCYSFSVGEAVGPWQWIGIGLVVLLADHIVAAVILWLMLSRKRKYLPNKTKEDN